MQEDFKKELKELAKKYKVTIHEWERTNTVDYCELTKNCIAVNNMEFRYCPKCLKTKGLNK